MLRDLKEIGFLEHWEFCNAKKERITDEECIGVKDEIKHRYIRFKIKDAPDLTQNALEWKRKRLALNSPSKVKTTRKKKTTKKE